MWYLSNGLELRVPFESRTKDLPMHQFHHPNEISLVQGSYIEALFVDRPNRFVVKARTEDDSIVEAYLPNTGNLSDLLFPGARMVLETPLSPGKRKTHLTASAVYRNDRLIGLSAVKATSVAAFLIENMMVPGLEETHLIGSEVRFGRHRFDFMIEDVRGKKFFMEVKSVSSCVNGIAMFPDAITVRGSKHLLELAKASEPDANSVVLFLVQGDKTDLFIPNYHTDLSFATTMLSTRNYVRYIPVAVEWESNMTLSDSVKLLDIPWDFVESQIVDTGAYLLILRVDYPSVINVGSLGNLEITAGYYIYVGSGMQSLSARIARHMRKRKQFRWHVDYLRKIANHVQSIPVRSSRSIEIDLASEISRIYISCFPGFGASDSPLSTHLFYSSTHPSNDKAFNSILHRFRFTRP